MSLRNLTVNKIPQKYKLVLMKCSEEKIAELTDIEVQKIIINHEDVSELNFTVPFYITDEITMQSIKNPLFDLVKESLLVQVNDCDVFSIKKIEEEENIDGTIQKTVECYSREIGLGKLPIVISEKIRQLIEGDVENGQGVVDLVHQVCTWRVRHIDEKAKYETKKGIKSSKYRHFDTGESYVLNFLKEEITKAYDCLVLFDTKNKEFDIYDRKSYGVRLPITLSKENFVNNFKKSSDGTQIITRLRARGKNNLVFNTINPLGTDYIEDVTPFRNETFMSKELLQALNKFDERCKILKPKWLEFREMLSDRQKRLMAVEKTIKELESKIRTYKNEQNELIKEKSKFPKGNVAVDKTLLEVASKLHQENEKLHYQKQLEQQLENEKQFAQTQINYLKTQYDKKTVVDTQGRIFNKNLLGEYENFIYTDTYSNENCLDVDTLYEETQKELEDKNTPIIDFDINIEDFLSFMESGIEEYNNYDFTLRVGDFVELYSEKLNNKVWVRLISYEHNPSSNTLNLQFSNKDKTIDGLGSLGSALEQMHKIAQKVEINKCYWDLSKGTSNWVKDFRTNSLDLVAQQIKSKTTRNKVDISELGIYLSDMGNEQEQLAMTNNIIAMTTDGWSTCDVAITPHWINGKLICAETLTCEQLDVVARKKLEQGGEALLKLKTTAEEFSVQIQNATTGIESKITQSVGLINQKVQEIKQGLETTIQQNKNSIISTVNNTITGMGTKITQLENTIENCIHKGDFSSLMKQNVDEFLFQFNEDSPSVKIDKNGILVRRGDGTYFRIGDNGISHYQDKSCSGSSLNGSVHCASTSGVFRSSGRQGARQFIGLPSFMKGRPYEVVLAVKDTYNGFAWLETDSVAKIYCQLVQKQSDGFVIEAYWIARNPSKELDDKPLEISYIAYGW